MCEARGNQMLRRYMRHRPQLLPVISGRVSDRLAVSFLDVH